MIPRLAASCLTSCAVLDGAKSAWDSPGRSAGDTGVIRSEQATTVAASAATTKRRNMAESPDGGSERRYFPPIPHAEFPARTRHARLVHAQRSAPSERLVLGRVGGTALRLVEADECVHGVCTRSVGESATILECLECRQQQRLGLRIPTLAAKRFSDVDVRAKHQAIRRGILQAKNPLRIAGDLERFVVPAGHRQCDGQIELAIGDARAIRTIEAPRQGDGFAQGSFGFGVSMLAVEDRA